MVFLYSIFLFNGIAFTDIHNTKLILNLFFADLPRIVLFRIFKHLIHLQYVVLCRIFVKNLYLSLFGLTFFSASEKQGTAKFVTHMR